MRILSLIILSLMISNPSWAYLTAGKIAVTATSSSSGVPSTSQDSDITDTKGSSVAVGVPVAVTGNVNITGNYLVNGTPISATSNWNQSGSTINYTAGNVGIGSANPGQMLDVQGTVRSLGFSGPSNSPYIKVSERETNGTNGQTSGFTVGLTNVVLNTKDFDTANIATLCTGNAAPISTCTAANEIVLPAGTYEVNAAVPFDETSGGQAELYNMSSSSQILYGNTIFTSNSVQATTFSFIKGQFTLASAAAMSVRAYAGYAGYIGFASSLIAEVYTIVEFTKIQ